MKDIIAKSVIKLYKYMQNRNDDITLRQMSDMIERNIILYNLRPKNDQFNLIYTTLPPAALFRKCPLISVRGHFSVLLYFRGLF